jgi:hypothetical protein
MIDGLFSGEETKVTKEYKEVAEKKQMTKDI